MSDQNNPSEPPDSLLRRLLGQDQEPRAPDEDLPEHEVESMPSDAMVSPIPGYTIPAQPDADTASDKPPTSPIRPTVHDGDQPQELLTPSLPDKAPPATLSPREQMQRAEEALIHLRQKMAQVAAEFAQGKLNRAQFDAIYSRYSEQRDITERLLARNPESQAWQSVIQAGHTGFLKQRFEARVISYAIYDRESFKQITVTGPIQLERAQTEAALKRLKAITRGSVNPGPAYKKIGDGRCVLFVPGETTVAVTIFSLEPSATQIGRVQDIHHDFERANQHALLSQDYVAERLVFPHRALFEEKKY